MEIIGYNLVCYAVCPSCAAIIKYLPTELTIDPDRQIGDVFDFGMLKCPSCGRHFNPYGENKYEIECAKENTQQYPDIVTYCSDISDISEQAYEKYHLI